MSGGWQTLLGNDAAEVLAALNPHFRPLPVEPEAARVRGRPLPFYPLHALFAVTNDGTVPPNTRHALLSPRDVAVLDGSNGPIYAVNERAPVVLTADNIKAYLKFFLGYVRGPYGRFALVERPEDIAWTPAARDSDRAAAARHLRPLTLEAADPDEGFRLAAVVQFERALLGLTLHVAADGTVGTSGERILFEPLAADPPSLIGAL